MDCANISETWFANGYWIQASSSYQKLWVLSDENDYGGFDLTLSDCQNGEQSSSKIGAVKRIRHSLCISGRTCGLVLSGRNSSVLAGETTRLSSKNGRIPRTNDDDLRLDTLMINAFNVLSYFF